MEFINWLQDELNKRGWSQSDLARATKLSRGAIGNVIRHERNPGAEMLRAIAKAFQISPDIVFRKAGVLPESPELAQSQKRKIEQLMYLIEHLPEEDQNEIIKMMETVAKYKIEKRGENG